MSNRITIVVIRQRRAHVVVSIDAADRRSRKEIRSAGTRMLQSRLLRPGDVVGVALVELSAARYSTAGIESRVIVAHNSSRRACAYEPAIRTDHIDEQIAAEELICR
jgi:hypothetical protein